MSTSLASKIVTPWPNGRGTRIKICRNIVHLLYTSIEGCLAQPKAAHLTPYSLAACIDKGPTNSAHPGYRQSTDAPPVPLSPCNAFKRASVLVRVVLTLPLGCPPHLATCTHPQQSYLPISYHHFCGEVKHLKLDLRELHIQAVSRPQRVDMHTPDLARPKAD